MSNPDGAVLVESWLELPDGRLFWLKDRCAIGRDPKNDLVLDTPAVSRHHALLIAHSTGYAVSDVRSSNGTYVNGVAVTRPAALRDGDEIRLGNLSLRFRRTRVSDPTIDGSVPSTHRLQDVSVRACWLLLADVVQFSSVIAQHGNQFAVQQIQRWIGGVRPLLLQHGAIINCYVGDAIFAWWPGESAPAARVRAALAALEAFRPRSPLPFRVIAHRGSVLFTRGEHGEELTGQDVNFLFRAEKIAKRLGAPMMLSEPAVDSLELRDRAPPLGRSTVEGIPGDFAFFALGPS